MSAEETGKTGGPEPTRTPGPDLDPDPEARGLRLVIVLLALTVVSGLIDAVSYLGLEHVFTANMTGNIVVLGFAAAGAPGFSVSHTLTSLATFLVGAVAGGRIALRLDERSRRTWTRLSLAAEAVLVGAAAVIAFATPDAGTTVYAVIAVTAFAMGLRNATVRRLGVPALTTTTVVTMTLTRLAGDSPAAAAAATTPYDAHPWWPRCSRAPYWAPGGSSTTAWAFRCWPQRGSWGFGGGDLGAGVGRGHKAPPLSRSTLGNPPHRMSYSTYGSPAASLVTWPQFV